MFATWSKHAVEATTISITIIITNKSYQIKSNQLWIFHYYKLIQRTSCHKYLRVVRKLKSIYTLQGKTWQHDSRMISKTLHVATVHDNNQGVDPGPTSPYHMSSTWYLSRLSVGGPYTIPIYITAGMMRHRPTQWPSKLLSLQDPINLHASVHNQCLLIRAQTMWSLTDTGGSYHLGASDIF
jgi:hypothetical protein